MNFNTSNVTIKQQLCETSYLCMFHFNTSNVTIKLGHISEGFVSFVVISIHLMLLLNPSKLATLHFPLYLKAYIYQQLSIFLPAKFFFL